MPNNKYDLEKQTAEISLMVGEYDDPVEGKVYIPVKVDVNGILQIVEV